MNLRRYFCWLLGHTYSVKQPHVIGRNEWGFWSLGHWAVCECCGATVSNPDESLPVLMPEWHNPSVPEADKQLSV